ncbi:DUF2478 domain-containing protein [Bradyrhizobium sp. CCGUVB23]|uniref:DUF2478 domain-containing protein n=1 Tax=Bradyrhizobium sp. CCGUVB23 TaxID=2949630 RepID=UPI0020B26C45|nr:DUF2478 domain-containing protein [Bradyrhizobium sp. CCGUVB23]MCP3467239.1 DUF2478 domain-containing protein [Bradyrhizobium sp. CCGUVB23]
MFDAQSDLAALVYEPHQDPDTILRGFAADLNARGLRVVGMVQAGHCADSSLSAVLLHNGEKLLLAQDFDLAASGCRLDLARLQNAGEQIAEALAHGADLVIINRFGKRERNGKGLAYLIERAFNADIPVVIAVANDHFADWIKFAGGMSVKLRCERHALDAWWQRIATPSPCAVEAEHSTVCAVLK